MENKLPPLHYAFVDADTIPASGRDRYQLVLFPTTHLVTTTGQIAACDPSFPQGAFARMVQPRSYPVTLSIAIINTAGYAKLAKSGMSDDEIFGPLDRNGRRHKFDQRVAFSRIDFQPRLQPADVVQWEIALFVGQSYFDAQSGRASYGVDSGTGCFAQPEALTILNGERSRELYDQMSAGKRSTYQHTWSWGDVVVDETNGLNVIAFTSGWGDGRYISYWGLDANEQPLCIVTDFGVIGY